MPNSIKLRDHLITLRYMTTMIWPLVPPFSTVLLCVLWCWSTGLVMTDLPHFRVYEIDELMLTLPERMLWTSLMNDQLHHQTMMLIVSCSFLWRSWHLLLVQSLFSFPLFWLEFDCDYVVLVAFLEQSVSLHFLLQTPCFDVLSSRSMLVFLGSTECS